MHRHSLLLSLLLRRCLFVVDSRYSSSHFEKIELIEFKYTMHLKWIILLVIVCLIITIDFWFWMFVKRPRFAVVTMLTGSDDYLLGALTLAQSIGSRHRTNATSSRRHFELVCMVTPNVSSQIRDILHDVGGFSIVNVSPIGNPSHDASSVLRFENVYTKLNAFKLVQYEQILFLDADTLVVGPIDELLNLRIGGKFIAAANDCCDRFNSGVFVVKPSLRIFESMMNHLNDYKSYDHGDQGFLNRFYSKWQLIPYEFNAQLPDYIDLPSVWDDRELKIIHYEKVKPWRKYDKSLEPVMQRWHNVFKTINDTRVHEYMKKFSN